MSIIFAQSEITSIYRATTMKRMPREISAIMTFLNRIFFRIFIDFYLELDAAYFLPKIKGKYLLLLSLSFTFCQASCHIILGLL